MSSEKSSERSGFTRTPLILLISLAALVFIVFIGCGDGNYLESISNDDSASACQYQVSIDLDSGNYDAVIASSCANHMDRAAAYLGKAGFKVIDIVNKMIDANDSGSPMDVYMNELIGNVSTQDLMSLDNSRRYYSMVNAANGYSPDIVSDALFLKSSLVSTTVSFSFIKSSIDPDGDGVISSCDTDGNSVPDEVDAMSCALIFAGGATDCLSLGFTVDDSTYRSLSFPAYSNFYNGLVMTGIANASCPDSTYNQLLYDSNTVAVTSLEKCVDPTYPSVEWNCPFEDSTGSPEDLLSVFNDAIQNSITTLESLGFDEESEVYAAINTISVDACGGGACTEAQLQAYLESQLGL